MIAAPGNMSLPKTTAHRAVIPFYIYSAITFFISAVLLLLSQSSFEGHFFNPHTLALTHLLALGWGTMIILGACHQLVPVLTGGKLFSEKLAIFSFIFTGAGIPLLVVSFYFFNLDIPLLTGAVLINLGIIFFLVNIFMTIRKSKSENVHAIFLFTATLWLFLTTLFGLLLAINFTHPFFKFDSLHYLPLHAHMGIAGWFLLLITGVGSRLIPLFLISKYTSEKTLWAIFILINAGLVGFIADNLFTGAGSRNFVYVLFVFAGLVLFAVYCSKAYRARIRRQVDPQLKLSLISVMLLFVPVLSVSAFLAFPGGAGGDSRLIHFYGFTIFMGWITAIILGMSFKTFPFIVWHKVYHLAASAGKTPSPKELFSDFLFRLMFIFYLAGMAVTGTGILTHISALTCTGSFLLVMTAFFYNWNIFKIALHKPQSP